MSENTDSSPAPTDARNCHGCGKELHRAAEMCPNCGVRQPDQVSSHTSSKKILPAFLLAFFLGVFGIHRFYIGKVGTGIVMLLLTITLVGSVISGIWALIDWIMIVCGAFKDSEGQPITEWT